MSQTLASNTSSQNESSDIRSSLEALSSSRETLQLEIEKQNSTLLALNEEREKLKEKNKELRKKGQTRQDAQKRIRFLEKKLMERTTELEKEREERQAGTGIDGQVVALQETVAAYQMREKQLVEETMAAYQMRENQLIEELEVTRQRVGNMDQEVGNQREELDRRAGRIRNLEEENERLRTVKEEMSIAIERTKLRINELEGEAKEQGREKIKELEEEIEERERLVVKIGEDRRREGEKRMELERVLGEVMMQVEEVKTRMAEREVRMESVLRESYQKAAEAQSAGEMKEWMEGRERENEKWQQKMEELATRANELEEREKNVEELEAREKELETREKELETRANDVEKREKNMEELEEWRKKVERVESQEKKVEKLRKQVEDLEMMMQVLEQRENQLDEHESEMEEDDGRNEIESVWRRGKEVEKLTQQVQDLEATMQGLERREKKLEECEKSPETPFNQLTEERQAGNLPDLEAWLRLIKITDVRLESRKRTINLESTSSDDSASTNTTTAKRLKTAKIPGRTLSASSSNPVTTPRSDIPSITPLSFPRPKSHSQKPIPGLSRPLGTLGFAGSSILISSCPEQISRVTVGLLSTNAATPLSISTALSLIIPRLTKPLTPADAELVINIVCGVLKRIYTVSLAQARGERRPSKSHADDRKEFTNILIRVLKDAPIPVLMGFYEQLFKMLKECVMKYDIETRRICWPEKEVDITEANAAKEAGVCYLRVLEKTWRSEGLKVESVKSITSDDLMMLCLVGGPLVEGVVNIVGAEKVMEIWGAGEELKCKEGI
jgi:hypothetical protein